MNHDAYLDDLCAFYYHTKYHSTLNTVKHIIQTEK